MSKWNMQRLAHFAAVAGAPSLSMAARALGLSQPALTTSIRKLERELGFDLFDREHGFELNGMGREFLMRARRVLSHVDDLEHEVELLRAGELGELHIACGPTVADGFVGIALGRLHKAHPGVNIAVQVGPHPVLPSLLRSRKVDLIVVEISLIEHDSEFEIETLPEQEIVIYTRANHPLAGKKRVKPEDLFRYPAVGTHLPPWAEAWLKKHQPADGSYPGLQLECSHHALLKQVVMASDAVSGAPREVLRAELECGALTVIDLAAETMHNRAGVVWLRGRSLSPAASRLIEELKRVIAS